LIDLIAKSIAYSSGIGIGAMAITLIYSSTRTFNFAHASMVTIGFYAMFTGTYILGGSPYYYLLLAGLMGSIAGLLIFYGLNLWLLRRGASEITLMMSTLGADLILFGLINIYIDYLVKIVAERGLVGVNPKFFLLETRDFTVTIGDFEIRGIALVAPLILVLATLLLHLFLTRTKIGIAMRATIENPSLASLLGINPEVLYLLAWLIGGFLAGLSGGILSLVTTGYNTIGVTLIVTFFAGAIVGGLYSIIGGLLGGLLVGLSEYIGITLLSFAFGGGIIAYRPAIPLAIMALTLLIQPTGLAGIQWRALYQRVVEALRR